MLDPAHPHPLAAFWLDVADKLLKLAAVLIGAAWTWMHYHRSRTYAPKLELHLEGNTFRKGELYMEAVMQINNLGASRHALPTECATCEITAIIANGTERQLQLTRAFNRDTWIESRETVRDLIYIQIDDVDDLIWLRVDLRVTGKQVEWNDSLLIRAD